MLDKMPFLLGHTIVKEEDKVKSGMEMKRLCHLGILKQHFLLTLLQLC